VKLLATAGDRRIELTVERAGGAWSFRAGSQDGVLDVLEIAPGVYSVLDGDRSHEVRLWAGPEGWTVEVEGHRLDVALADPRDAAAGLAGADGGARLELKAPMPGKVVRVLVQEGDLVEAGQGIAVVEAMKMQNEMKARRGGRVVTVRVAEGAAVAAGEVLAVIE